MLRVRGLLSSPTKMVLVVRGDLKLSKGKTGSQCAHAAVMCFVRAQRESPDVCRAWLGQGQPKIVLKVDSLGALHDLRESVERAGMLNEVVRDAGRTEIPAGTETVLGIGPDHAEKVDALVKHLKLL